MATQGERLEALEKENGELKERLADVERILKDGEALDELRDLVAKAASLSDFEELAEKVAKHEAALAENTAQLLDGEASTAPDDFNARAEVLKVHRQLEGIANHLNFRLTA